ncbi:DNA phosphorothioation-associated putative methyltransferase [Antrihabitans sp. YC2-6]|nr:DNA phosphorothioation-associated putative methyltransferase [Antrihabitans sp. YC2-6]
MKLAIESDVIRDFDDVFDYGCGRGSDIDFLRLMGYTADGWDPHHRPGAELCEAAVVNLGYVINVIELPSERVSTLKKAFELAKRALVVSVRTTHEAKFLASATVHEDGILTGTDTFQRFFSQAEARTLIEDTLTTQCTPLAPGVFVVFRDEGAEQEWLDQRSMISRRVRRLRRITEPKMSIRDKAYETHRDILRPLEEFVAIRGRLPSPGEVDWQESLLNSFGSTAKAFQIIRHVANDTWWEDAAEDRRQELLVRFALQRIRRMPKFGALPVDLRIDVKELFGSYKAAVAEAEGLLFSLGSPETVRSAAAVSTIGKRTPDAFYAHVTAIELLPPILRVFIGAAETLIGEVQDATLVKVHFDKPRVSWLKYPDFDRDPHPALAESWVVDFRHLDVRPCDYRERDNPPILHRKELFVASDDPRHQRFKRLSDQEERHGLLDESHLIGTRKQWQARLAERSWSFKGARLVRADSATGATGTVDS